MTQLITMLPLDFKFIYKYKRCHLFVFCNLLGMPNLREVFHNTSVDAVSSTWVLFAVVSKSSLLLLSTFSAADMSRYMKLFK